MMFQQQIELAGQVAWFALMNEKMVQARGADLDHKIERPWYRAHC